MGLITPKTTNSDHKQYSKEECAEEIMKHMDIHGMNALMRLSAIPGISKKLVIKEKTLAIGLKTGLI